MVLKLLTINDEVFSEKLFQSRWIVSEVSTCINISLYTISALLLIKHILTRIVPNANCMDRVNESSYETKGY